MAGDYQNFTAIGRLTRDPERHDFPNGGAVVNFDLAFTGNSRKNPQTGQYEDEPCFLSCKAFIDAKTKRGVGDVVMRFTRKGTRIFITGRLVLEKWQDRNGGGSRQAIRCVIESLTLLGEKPADGGGPRGGQHPDNWDGSDGPRYGNSGSNAESGWGDSGHGAGNSPGNGGTTGDDWSDPDNIPF